MEDNLTVDDITDLDWEVSDDNDSIYYLYDYKLDTYSNGTIAIYKEDNDCEVDNRLFYGIVKEKETLRIIMERLNIEV